MQSGGSFDVDYEVMGPNNRLVMDGSKERQGDFVFTAAEPGEYRFCFNNEMSTFAEKFVDFEIAVSLSHTIARLTKAWLGYDGYVHGAVMEKEWMREIEDWKLTFARNRSKTNRAQVSLRSKEPLPNRRPPWKSQSSSYPVNYPP